MTLAATPATALEHQGAQVHPWWPDRTEADNLRELDVLASSGANSLRMDMPWSLVEPERGQPDREFLSRVDRYIDAAITRGMRPILNLHSTPCWASEGGRRACGAESGFEAPDDLKALESVSALLAGRYSNSLVAFEVWNEPNLPFFLRGARDKVGRARLYAPMLRASYRGVKRSAPRLDVLGGSISGTDSEFLRLLYERGVSGHYDAIAFHPYNAARPPAEPRPRGWPENYEFSHGTVRMLETMLRNGAAPRLWMTEYGWSACAYDESQRPSRCVDEKAQAAYLGQAAALVRTWFPFVEGTVWYELRDSRESVPPGCFECRFGLLRADFSPKPSLAAFRAANGPLGSLLLPARP